MPKKKPLNYERNQGATHKKHNPVLTHLWAMLQPYQIVLFVVTA